MSENSDKLLERIHRGDAEALAEWIERARVDLLVHIEKRLGPHVRCKVEPEDILQEVSAAAIGALRGIKLGGRHPRHWLRQLTERKILQAYRHYFGTRKRDPRRETELGCRDLADLAMTAATPSGVASRNERRAQLRLALAQRADKQREALNLRYVQCWSSKRIAKQLGKSDEAVRTMLSRALKRLQTLLGPEGAP